MFWAWSIMLSCFVIISLLVLGIIVLIVAKLMHKEKIADIATCFILWTIFPFILPFKAKKKELISKQIYSWILVVLAPIFICILLVNLRVNIIRQKFYKHIKIGKQMLKR